MLIGASALPIAFGLVFSRALTRAILGDLRFARLLHFVAIATLGVCLALRDPTRREQVVFGELVATFALFLVSLAYAAVFAIVTNNIEDLETDRITNRDRPLVRGDVAPGSYLVAGVVCLGVGLSLAWLAHRAIFWAIAGVSIVYVAYSCRPLRLKRIPVFAKLLFGVNALFIALCGFAMAGGDPRAFPVGWAIYLLVPLSLAANFVDLKDTEGDRRMRVLTLPVLLGEPTARVVISLATLAAYATAAVLLSVRWFYPVIALLALLHVYFVMRQPYREVFVFLVYLSGIFALSAVLASTPLTQSRAAAIALGRAFLIRSQASSGAISDPNNPLFDVWETIEAAIALRETGDSTEPALQRALAFLRANENPSGLVCHNQKCRAQHCLETSAEYLLLLGPPAAATRAAAISAMQNDDGSWAIGNPDVREQPEFPSVTAFVIGALEASGVAASKKAHAWLLSAQNAEGHFGSAWEYYATPAYALWPAMRALEDHDALARAEAYIRGAQLDDGGWYHRDPSRPKWASKELQTALMLSALRYGDRERNRATVERGVQFLLRAQRADGSWDGGDFPIASVRYQKKEHIFATARALSVLAWYGSTP